MPTGSRRTAVSGDHRQQRFEAGLKPELLTVSCGGFVKGNIAKFFACGLIHRPKRLDATRVWGTRYGGRVVRFVIFLGVTEASGGSKTDPANAPNSPKGQPRFFQRERSQKALRISHWGRTCRQPV